MDVILIDTRLNRFPSQVTSSINDDIVSSREWLIPLRCNFWVQFAFALLLTGTISGILFLVFNITVLLGIAFYSLIIAALLFIATLCGRDTIRAYRRVRRHIKHYGSFDIRLQNELMKHMYCRRAGARAAAKDLGASDELLPALANAWPLL